MRNYEHGRAYPLKQIEADMVASYRETNERRVAKGTDPVPEAPGGFMAAKWEAFTGAARPGDEFVWYYWRGGPLAMRCGWRLIRDGKDVAFYLSRMA